MIAPDRNEAARRRIDQQDRRRLAPADRVKKMQFEAKKIVGSKRRREDYVEVRHQTIIAGGLRKYGLP